MRSRFAEPCVSLNTACAASTNAIGYAADLIRDGRIDVALVGGADELSISNFAGFGSLEALSPDACRPFSGDRAGLSLGEGGAMLLLASSDVADDAGVAPLGEVLGYGLSADGYHAVAPSPDGEGAARAISAALAMSGVVPSRVSYVNAHGTATQRNDSAETNAIHTVFEGRAFSVPVSSTKSMIGHLLGAAGAAEAIVTLHALREEVVPPTAGLRTPDPECDLDYVPDSGRAFKVMSPSLTASPSVVPMRASSSALSSSGVQPPDPKPDRVAITGLATIIGGDEPCAGNSGAGQAPSRRSAAGSSRDTNDGSTV